MKTFRAEFHIHTVLSPCADVEMIPPLIVQNALEKAINLIAITDHNASANVGSVINAAKGTGLTVLPGMELQTREEVHVLCLFDNLDQVREWQKLIEQLMPQMANDADHFGEQFIVDETGDFLAQEEKLLSTSANITLKNAWDKITQMGGILIPAHVNREAFGLLPILGFVPPDIHPEALEISKHLSSDDAYRKFPQLKNFPLIQSGDAHRLEEILGWNYLSMNSPSINEIKMAFKGIGGRSVQINSRVH